MANVICVDIYEDGCPDDAEPVAAARFGSVSVCLFSAVSAENLQDIIKFLQTVQMLSATPVTQH